MTNWVGFSIAFVLFGIVPIWLLNFTADIGIVKKLFFTLAIAGVVYWSVENGGSKRGFISR